MTQQQKAIAVLTMNTLAFSVCFGCWMAYSILVAYLVLIGEFNWTASQIGSLVAIPVLTGSLMRLPVGVLTDMFGGRLIFTALMLVAAVPMYLVGHAQTYGQFWWAGLGFGLTGASFAVGVAYTSIWFSKARQGTALGVFGAGNTGAALTTLGAPLLLQVLRDWRMLPKIFAALLVLTAVLFFVFTHTRKVDEGAKKNFKQRLAPLAQARVWRFGLYYFLVFGGFVALTSWLPNYYVNVYGLDLVTVGILSSVFVLSSGLIRAVGGWMSDRWGARKIMYGILTICSACSFLLAFGGVLNRPLFTAITFLIAIAMGTGMAAVYKHIPDYFPNEVGVVGGIVGVLGGLGGYFCPKIFGLLLQWTGVWSTCWMFLALISCICLGWMHVVVSQMAAKRLAQKGASDALKTPYIWVDSGTVTSITD